MDEKVVKEFQEQNVDFKYNHELEIIQGYSGPNRRFKKMLRIFRAINKGFIKTIFTYFQDHKKSIL